MKSSSYIIAEKEANVVYSKNLYCDDFKNHITYVSSSETIKSYTGDKEFFIGSKTIKEPEGLDKVSLDNSSRTG
jgi:hypothetical protein